MTSIAQARFISLTRFPELQGEDSETIQRKLSEKYGSDKIEVLDNDTVVIRNS